MNDNHQMIPRMDKCGISLNWPSTPRVEAQIVTDGSPRLFYGIGDGTDTYHVANGRSSAHKQASQMPNLGQILKSCCTMSNTIKFKLIDTAWDVLPNTQVVLQCNWMRCVVAVEVGKSKKKLCIHWVAGEMYTCTG